MIFGHLINKYIYIFIVGIEIKYIAPLVAYVSISMSHDSEFNQWWDNAGKWYSDNGIDRNQFSTFPFSNGINKGDILIVKGVNYDEIKVGDIIVFWSERKDPIAHRVTKKWEENGVYFFQTKGDNYKTNYVPIKSTVLDETKIPQAKVIGVVNKRIPKIGWLKINYVEFLNT